MTRSQIRDHQEHHQENFEVKRQATVDDSTDISQPPDDHLPHHYHPSHPCVNLLFICTHKQERPAYRATPPPHPAPSATAGQQATAKPSRRAAESRC